MDRQRALDLALLLPALPVYAPLALGLAVLACCCQGRPVFFRQQRLGLRGRPFVVLKLRTMSSEPEVSARQVTPLGRWLRRRGLDELPQFLSVLRGDMSLVGPRPLTRADHERLVAAYAPFAARLAARPGITGLAQVCQLGSVFGTSELDALYIQRRSAELDLRILATTVGANLRGKVAGRAQGRALARRLGHA